MIFLDFFRWEKKRPNFFRFETEIAMQPAIPLMSAAAQGPADGPAIVLPQSFAAIPKMMPVQPLMANPAPNMHALVSSMQSMSIGTIPNDGSVASKVLQAMSTGSQMTAKEIANAALGKGTPAKEVNPTLYALWAKHAIQKIDGSPPRWQILGNVNYAQLNLATAPTKAAVEVNTEELEEKITAFLRGRGVGVDVPLKDIVEAVLPDQKTAVNSRLFAMSKKGLVQRTTDDRGTKPHWKILN